MSIAAGIRGMNRVQRISLIAAIGVGALSVTGCSYINQQTTTVPYSPSDGVRTDLGNLELRNIMIVSNGDGKPGRVLGAVYNTSTSPITLTISGTAGSQTTIDVKPSVPYYLNTTTAPAILDSVAAAPGAMENVTLSQTGTGAASAVLNVPILNGTLTEYAQYVPTAAATSSSTDAVKATDTPTP